MPGCSPTEYSSNSKSFCQRFFGRIVRLGSRRAGRQLRNHPGSPAAADSEGSLFCGLDFKSPKIDCRWNSAAVCAFVCYPVEFEHTKLLRRLPGPRITPEARAPESRPPTAGRASTPQSGRTPPPLSCRAQYRKKTGNDVTRQSHAPRFNDGNQPPETREDSDGTHVLGSRALLTQMPPARR